MSSTSSGARRIMAARAGLAACVVAAGLSCGEYFPNQFLLQGDKVVLAASPFEFATLVEPLLPKSVGSVVALPEAKYAFVDARSDEGADRGRARESGAPPAEFDLYEAGLERFRAGDHAGARAQWERLLALPAGERKWRSTWASYMLGRSWHAADPARAAGFYARTRELAAQGFADSIGLATASIGWDGRLAYDQGDLLRAIHLYLEQGAAEDPTAVMSLWRCADLVHRLDESGLDRLAGDPWSRRIVTAWLVSEHRFEHDDETIQRTRPQGLAERWLAAVERRGAQEIAFADMVAWAAYQAARFDLAGRWAARAGDDAPRAAWVRAKLAMREGRLDDSAALLSKAVRAMPRAPKGEGAGQVTAAGEAGVLLLTARQYEEALDSLLLGAHWHDAAYIAERVLSLDELVAYVDRRWPEQLPAKARDGVFSTREAVRHLLARRLMRAGEIARAHPYFPVKFRPVVDRLAVCLEEGRAAGRAKQARARSLLEAARITRHLGMELLGSELAPDWAVSSGGSRNEDVFEARKRISAEERTAVQPDEARRVKSSEIEPELRFHYRYLACDLAWEAASLMPDGSDQTAAVLCEAGSWIKLLEPKLADRFYKAMVNRCGSTRLGKQADEARWFPELREDDLAFADAMPSTTDDQ